jgi:SAM-dependent methyltransferase
MNEAAIWQQVEFGSYSADLTLWAELADAAEGPVLELGAGAGRVALHLADRGNQLLALEQDPGLLRELESRAKKQAVGISAVRADLTSPADLRLPRRPSLVIGPLHVIQLLDGAGRLALLSRLGDLVAPGATLALTVVDESTLLSAGTAANITGGHQNRRRIMPDMQEVDGWVFSSEPLWVQVSDDSLTVRRIRERVSPEGKVERRVHDELLYRVSPERLELEGEGVGLVPAGRRQISYGPDEADSTVVLLEAPR